MTRILAIISIVAGLTVFALQAGCTPEGQDGQTETDQVADDNQAEPDAVVDDVPAEPVVDDEPAPAVDDVSDEPVVDDELGPAVDDLTDGQDGVPDHRINRLDALLRIDNITPAPQTRQEAEHRFGEMQLELIELGEATIADYPDAENTVIVRSMMLQAAAFLHYRDDDTESRERLLEVTDGILATDAPAAVKLPADTMRTRTTLNDFGVDKAEALTGLTQRYAETEVAGQALLNAAVLADAEQMTDLRDEFADTLQADYASEGNIASFLINLGRKVPFSAVLTRLDGTTLTLPDDLLGKVVIVEFWATWCPPCVQSMPHMKQLYENNKDKGLEVVGISLDYPGDLAKVQLFVSTNEYNWIHTFSDQSPDPTATNYDINVTPTIWVVGRDGTVISNNAMDRTARTLAQAMAGVDRIVEETLAQPAPQATE